MIVVSFVIHKETDTFELMLKGVGPLDSLKMGLVTRNWNFQPQGPLGRGTRFDELPGW